MNYQESLDYINSKLRFGSKPGLSRIGKLCGLMGNPQNDLKFIHIAGTNGKGSTGSMCAGILKHAGYKTGLFISPYVFDFRERMSINGEYISKSALADITGHVKKLADIMESEESPTEFELITAIAFEYFKREKCDIVVLETGLGGRFDATNIIEPPQLSIITKISFDHTEYLGDTLSKITFEKCGIIKKGGVTVTYPNQPDEALAVIKKRANEENNKLIIPESDLVNIKESGIDGLDIEYKKLNIHIPLAGFHQAYNCVTAIESIMAMRDVYGYKINDEDIICGIKETKLHARFEMLSKKPLIIFDGAHNSDGVLALCDMIDKTFTDKNIYTVMGMLKDKEYKICAKEMAKRSRAFYAISPDNPRALSAKDMAEAARPYCHDVGYFDDYKTAIDEVRKKAGDKGVIIICGSLYIAGKMRETVIN